jgi:hypothetical protein
MEKPTCKTCLHWNFTWIARSDCWAGIHAPYDCPDSPEGLKCGECHFNPEAIMTIEDYWCGQHQDFPKWVKECQK